MSDVTSESTLPPYVSSVTAGPPSTDTLETAPTQLNLFPKGLKAA